MKTLIPLYLCIITLLACSSDFSARENTQSSDGSVTSSDTSFPSNPNSVNTYRTAANGSDIAASWSDLEYAGMNNTKIKSVDMLKGEVWRALETSWVVNGVDQWKLMKPVLGDPNYIDSWKADRFPNPQRQSIYREMAESVCTSAVERDSSSTLPLVFNVLNPSQSGTEAKRTEQFIALYKRILRNTPPPDLVTKGLQLFNHVQAIDGDAQAWIFTCKALIASSGFLVY